MKTNIWNPCSTISQFGDFLLYIYNFIQAGGRGAKGILIVQINIPVQGHIFCGCAEYYYYI